MTQSHSSELAKQGDPQAISALINKALNPKGLKVHATLTSGCLTLITESQTPPETTFVVDFIYKGLKKLNPNSVEKVVIQGKISGQSNFLWREEFSLESPSTESESVQPRKGTLRELFTRYLGQDIGINYKSPTTYEEAKLLEAENEYFYVLGKETGLKYYFPYSVILSITGTETAIVVGGNMFIRGKTFPLLIQVNHLIVYSGSIGVSF